MHKVVIYYIYNERERDIYGSKGPLAPSVESKQLSQKWHIEDRRRLRVVRSKDRQEDGLKHSCWNDPLVASVGSRQHEYDGTFEGTMKMEGMCAIRASLDRHCSEWWVGAGVVKWGTKVGPGSGCPWQQGIQGEVWGDRGRKNATAAWLRLYTFHQRVGAQYTTRYMSQRSIVRFLGGIKLASSISSDISSR